MTVNDALKAAASQIAPACEINGANPARVAKALLMRHLGVKIEWIFLNLTRELDDVDGYFALAKRFANHEPLEYITGAAGDEILKNIILVAKNRGVKYLACEMGYDQKASLESVLELSGFEAEFYRDLAGFDRGFVARNIFTNF